MTLLLSVGFPFALGATISLSQLQAAVYLIKAKHCGRWNLDQE